MYRYLRKTFISSVAFSNLLKMLFYSLEGYVMKTVTSLVIMTGLT